MKEREAADKRADSAEPERDTALVDVATIMRRLDELSDEIAPLRNERAAPAGAAYATTDSRATHPSPTQRSAQHDHQRTYCYQRTHCS